MFAPLAVLLLTAAPAAPAAERDAATHTSIDAGAKLPAELEGCLDHAVVELSLGAKKEGRVWAAKGALLHATLAKELNVLLRVEPVAGGIEFRLHADWPGAPKEPALQGELEARAIAAVSRAARICGIVQAEATCRRTPAGASAQSCTPART